MRELHSRTRTGRHRIDLRALPAWVQYIIALSTVAAVVALAWHVGKDNPIPIWISRYLIPALGWIYLALVVYLIVLRVVNRKPPKPRSP